MRNRTLVGVSAIGACALACSAFTGAWANPPSPLRDMLRTHSHQYTFNGRVTVNDVLRVQKNASVYGHAYDHKGLQVWDGLLVRNGGIKADSIEVTGPIQVQSATVAGVLQAGAISGTTLTLTGNETVGGTLAATGKISGNGLDGGTGGLTTSGNVSAAALAASSANISGGINAGQSTVNNLTVTGTANFNGATVSGLNIGNLVLNGATLSSVNIGSPSSTASPLNVSENGHTSQVGVSSSGALSLGDVATSGALSVAGSGGITAGLLQAPVPSGGSSPGVLTLQGSTISLTGNTALSNGSDLTFAATSGAASHLVAGNDGDVAGTVKVHVTNGQTTTTESTQTVTFAQPFAAPPFVTVTPAQDPDPDATTAPKYWVTVTQGSGSNYVSFTLHYIPAATAKSARDINFNYHVIG